MSCVKMSEKSPPSTNSPVRPKEKKTLVSANDCGGTRGSHVLVQAIDSADENCISHLKSVIEELRVEIRFIMDEQQKELMAKLDIQKGDMLQREAMLHSQIDSLRTEVENLSEKLQTLLKVESERKRQLEKLSTERQQLADKLTLIQKEQEEKDRCIHCLANMGKVTNV